MIRAHYYCETAQGIVLFVRLTPKAARNAVKNITEHSDGKTYLNIHISAIPEDGKANKALIKFLSKNLKIAASAIHLEKGQTSRFKQLHIHGDKTLIRPKLADFIS